MSEYDVKPKGIQDILGQRKAGVSEPKNPYEDYGNFAFGARAAAAGIPLGMAMRVGGPIQQTPGAESRNLWQKAKDFAGKFPFGDDPDDVKHIIEGYRYYQATKHNFYDPPPE